MTIQCMRKEQCEYPDCNCSDAVKKGRWTAIEVKTDTLQKQDQMHSEGDYERADPAKMQAELERHFGPALAGNMRCSTKPVIPIMPIDVVNNEPSPHELVTLAINQASIESGYHVNDIQYAFLTKLLTKLIV